MVSQWIGPNRSRGNAASLQERCPRSRAAREIATTVARESTTTAAHASARTSQPVALKRHQSTSPPKPCRCGPCCQKKQAQGPRPANSGCRKSHWSSQRRSTAFACTNPTSRIKQTANVPMTTVAPSSRPRPRADAGAPSPRGSVMAGISRTEALLASLNTWHGPLAHVWGFSEPRAERRATLEPSCNQPTTGRWPFTDVLRSRRRIAPPDNRQHENLQVEPEGPVLDVIDVVLDPPLQGAASAQTVHLRPAGHPRLDEMAREIMWNRPGELVDVVGTFRTGSDQAHFAAEHVPKLRQFVEIPPPHERSEAQQTRIAGLGAQLFIVPPSRFRRHAAQLVKGEGSMPGAHPGLAEEDRTGG